MSLDVAKRIQKVRERMKLTQTQFGELVGVSQPTVWRWENRKDKPEEENLRKIAEVARIDYYELVYGLKVEKGRVTVPVLGYVGAGETITPIDDHALGAGLDEAPVPPGAAAEGLAALRIRGSSMRPLRDGWLIYYSREVDGVSQDCMNELCVVKLADGRMYVKEVRRGYKPGHYNLHSWSPGVDVIEDQQVEWASPVRWITKG